MSLALLMCFACLLATVAANAAPTTVNAVSPNYAPQNTSVTVTADGVCGGTFAQVDSVYFGDVKVESFKVDCHKGTVTALSPPPIDMAYTVEVIVNLLPHS
jgi:hypothetical protein